MLRASFLGVLHAGSVLRAEAEDEREGTLHLGEGGSLCRSEAAEETSTGDGAKGAADRGAVGLDPGGGREPGSQLGGGARGGEGDDNDQLVVCAGEQLVDGDDERWTVLARLAAPPAGAD